MNEKHGKTLELDKILHQLGELTCCEYAKQQALHIAPITDITAVKNELQKTDDAFTLSAKFGTPEFLRIQSPDKMLKIAQAGGMLQIPQILEIGKILTQSALLIQWFGQCETVENTLQPFFLQLKSCESLRKRITSAILSETEIDDKASLQLSEIRRRMMLAQEKIKKIIHGIIRSSKNQKFLQETIVTMRDGRFVIPMKAEYKGEIPGLLHDTSHSGSTLFIEPMAVVEANNQIRALQRQEKLEIERILYELSALCATEASFIEENFQLSITLNLYFSKSNLAAKMKANMPQITNDGTILLRQARHPLIASKDVVPVDIRLGTDFDTLLITGPNTGGKTVSLKTMGLLTLMTMCGLLIPVASGSVISVFEHILVDIGDEQSIEQSLSTFSSHMSNIVEILKKANHRSLILLDELGSGTDPVEGAALAISILEQLRKQGSMVVATTHYAELKLYALETIGVENACCEFDVQTLSPTYRLMIGLPGRSNAFAISARLGLSQQILNKAEQFISKENQKLEIAMRRLSDARQHYESEQEIYKQKQREYQLNLDQLKETRKKMEKQQEKELENSRNKARSLVEQVALDAEEFIHQLDQLRKQKKHEDFAARAGIEKQKLRQKLNQLHHQANPVSEQIQIDYQLPRELKQGDHVLVMDLGEKAILLENPDSHGKVMVQVGLMKMRVWIKNLQLIDFSQKKFQTTRRQQTGSVHTKIEKSSSLEIDLRGKTGEEALMDMDVFMDRAVLSGILQITIIHGKGTGVLRKVVQQHLKNHPSVAHYRLGTFGEGESGVTIATLK